jgi:hypothetical protein
MSSRLAALRVRSALIAKFYAPTAVWSARSRLRRLSGKGRRQRQGKAVLIDSYQLTEFQLSALAVCQVLISEFGAEQVFFTPDPSRTRLVTRILRSAVRPYGKLSWDPLSREHLRSLSELLTEWRRTCSSPDDILDLSYDGVRVGQHAYDTYIRDGHLTASIHDDEIWAYVEKALVLACGCKSAVEASKIRWVIVSHDCYLTLGVLSDVAAALGIEVLWINPVAVSRVLRPYGSTSALVGRFRTEWANLGELSRGELRRLGATSLDKHQQSLRLSERQSGELVVDGQESPEAIEHSQDFATTSTPFFVIALHEFFDNPHCYGRMWFPDFWSWLCFVLDQAAETGHTWVLRPHPETLSRDLIAGPLGELVEENAWLSLGDPSEGWADLKAGGMRGVVTYYGSVTHEVSTMGLPVVCARPSPHEEYQFGHRASTKEEYASLIRGIADLDWAVPVRDDVVEFMAMHEHYRVIPNLFFENFWSVYEDIEQAWRQGDWRKQMGAEKAILQKFLPRGLIGGSVVNHRRFLDYLARPDREVLHFW